MNAFANPPAAPSFDYRSADPDLSIWGWSFKADPRRAEEFLDIHAASPHGVTITGSGTETVTTAAYFRGLDRVDVIGDGGMRSVRPSRSGQVTFGVDMGPPHPDQQYTEQAVLAGQDQPGYFAVRTERFDPHARLLLGPTRGMRRARRGHPFRIRVRALGRRLNGVRIVVRDARGRTVARSRRFSVGEGRQRVRVGVARRLRPARYSIAGTGRDALGRGVALGEAGADPAPGPLADDAREPVAHGRGHRFEVAGQAVIAGHRDHAPRGAFGREAERVALPLHHERRHLHGIELVLA